MNTERIVATAQILLSCLYVGGYFTMVGLFLMGYVRTPIEWKDQLTALLGVLTSGVLTILGYWFARTRPATPSGGA